MNTRPVTEARIWCLVAYRRYRATGRTPEQAMQLVYGDAAKCPDLTRRAWREFYANRYFRIVQVKRQHSEFWRYGETLQALERRIGALTSHHWGGSI